MSSQTVAALRAGLADSATVERYRSKIRVDDPEVGCWLWTGAVSGNGHGRFWLSDSSVVISHRFAWALDHGADLALQVEVLSHRCDNPLCQRPDHLTPTTNAENRRQWASRRHQVGGPLRDLRGARGRAQELRDAAARNEDLEPVAAAGIPELDKLQRPLF